MTKRKSDRMKMLRDLAGKREETAAIALGKSQQNVQLQSHRLQELQAFREEYVAQFQKNGQQGMSGSSVQLYQRFMQQLDHAISQQQGTLVCAKQDCMNKSTHWQDKHKSTRIFTNTLARAQTQEQHQANVREQKESDDRYKKGKGDTSS